MRTGCYNLLDSVCFKGFKILCSKRMEKILISSSHCSITTTCLFSTQNSNLQSGFLKYLDKGYTNLLVPLVIGSSAANIVNIIHLCVFCYCFNIKLFRNPDSPFSKGKSVWIIVCFHVHKSSLKLRSHFPFHQNLVSSHINNFRNMLNIHRTGFHTGTTVCTGPELIRLNRTGTFSTITNKSLCFKSFFILSKHILWDTLIHIIFYIID